MKQLVALSLLVLLFSCDEDDFKSLEVRDDSSVKSLNGTWRVIAYEDYEQGELIAKTEENSRGMDVIVTFDDTTDPPSIEGSNTTNSIWGTFEYTGPRSFSVPGLASTLVGQPEWGNVFSAIFTEGELVFTVNPSSLKIHNSLQQLSVVLEREQ
ncbi:MAG: hypothetical protein WBA23_05760 [Tunicatimonas sp.]|uniref:hypothetical protein n=1 Tax=Tunicatimonas sp. TaxID=1940096 RepID=UPI003C74D8CA